MATRKGSYCEFHRRLGQYGAYGVCFKGSVPLVQLLILHGADVNVVNSMGGTPLIYASTFQRTEIVKILLVHNAHKGAKDKEGKSALDHAKINGFTELIRLLVD
jgi:uncharacterized protein